MGETTTQTVELEVRGDGTALAEIPLDVSLESGIQGASSDKGVVRAICPNPANEASGFAYITGVPGAQPGVPVEPGTTVTLTLTYTGE
jgi:hypothetical protein